VLVAVNSSLYDTDRCEGKWNDYYRLRNAQKIFSKQENITNILSMKIAIDGHVAGAVTP
jgi:hypothetical protein